ncbi:sulfatase [Paraglaciecola aquimarina]|uniref:Sulfatase n=1 Tax=Paraglaciecola aquimarina TaxID=1235557 RepID=A0ABU3SXV0_9ALTE|nr:sulfatase [Paraglaciecola aquimarina]MDU0354747.1 sulfatase [Paraglaciecola aquimarina]
MQRVIPKIVKTNITVLASLAVVLLSVAVSSETRASQTSEQSTQRPNFVWIISEDNSPHYLRLYNPKHGVAMPNIENMAKQGLTYNNAYSNAPVCSTARSTLALGIYAPQAGTMHHRAFARAKYTHEDNKGVKSIYQLMKEAGYYVTNNAKTDFNYASESNEFSESSHSASWLNKQTAQPFFHIKTFTTTHESKLMFPVTDVKNKPTKHDPANVKLASIHPDTELFRYTHARYLDLHQALDKQVGEVLAELEQAGQLENTFVFYFGDHGGVLPGSKSFAKESGLKIPLVVRIPKNYQHLLANSTVQNSRIDEFVSFVDMAPTLLHLAGIEKSDWHSGDSFLGKNKPQQSKPIFGYADRFGERYDLVRTLRVGNLKYIRNYLPMNPLGLEQNYRFKNVAYQQWRSLYKNGQLNNTQAAFFNEKSAEELYDLSVDPEELNNLATDTKYQNALLDMRSQLQQQVKSIADLGFISEAWLETNEFADSMQLANSQHQRINQMVDAADLMLLPYAQAKDRLRAIIKHGHQGEQYWALVALSYFANQSSEFVPVIETLLADEQTHDLLKARAIEFLTRTGQLNPVAQLTSLIENSRQQLEALEMMNIAAVLHDSFGYMFDINARTDWSALPVKSAENYTTKKYQNGSVKVRVEYLKTPWKTQAADEKG